MSQAYRGWGDQPSVLIFADAEAARAASTAATESVGARVVGAGLLADALERLDRQASVDAVIVELDDPHSAEQARLIEWIDRAARDGRTAPLIVLPETLVNEVYAHIDEGRVQLLVEPATPQERAATLALALARRREALHDHGIEGEAERLRRLSEEVARIASALAEISSATRSVAHGAVRDIGMAGDVVVDADAVRGMIRVRRLRDQFFARELFADPAWDMLLDLMAARLEGSRVAVSSLCIAAAVPATTALRWIRTLTEHGLFVRSADPEDGRRIFIELSDSAFSAMMAYFQTLQQLGVRAG